MIIFYMKKMFNFLMNWLSYWYFQYELITCIYMFEPWEKKLLNGIIVMIISLVAYSSYMYLPHYTLSLLTELKILEMDSIRTESQLID
ncbi:serine palmitoyltransferase small subunit A [Macrosteles quadrilineatus]|uniref:serine palmitoyltransferase small subunit A n=1 Tax=Macrosteles quadrilineatus TaxID=74068 RepID=UPI0023E12F43|nr:serine palmitoyltransferase small subunit A [Macrosteles quadrilineatus]